MVEVGINVLFTTFTYTFGGKLYILLTGAPIGARVSCAAANLLMEWLWGEMRQLFLNSGDLFKLWEVENFVDDSRAFVNIMRRGTKFTGTKFK